MKPILVILGGACSLGAIASSLWWSYGGEETRSVVATFALWGGAGLFGFAGGYRGEIPRWDANASPFVRGLVAAFVGVAATFVGIAVANFRTDAGREALLPPTSSPSQWAALVEAEAQESGNGDVLSVICDKTRPHEDLASCAVTYEGPKCQYWFVGSTRDGEDEVRADEELFKERGTYDPSFGVLC